MNIQSMSTDELQKKIAEAQLNRDKYFDLGFAPRKRDSLLATIEVVFALGGMAGFISILMHGIGWVSSVFVAGGAWVLYSEKQRLSTRDFFRSEYRLADSRLEELKHELSRREESLETSEAEWMELLHGRTPPRNP